MTGFCFRVTVTLTAKCIWKVHAFAFHKASPPSEMFFNDWLYHDDLAQDSSGITVNRDSVYTKQNVPVGVTAKVWPSEEFDDTTDPPKMDNYLPWGSWEHPTSHFTES